MNDEPADERGAARTLHTADRSPAEILAASSLLPGLTPADFEAVSAETSRRSVEAGERLVSQGEAAGHLFVLAAGELDVTIDVGDAEQPVTRLEPGAVIGEIGLLAGETRSAHVTARTAADVVALTADGFAQLIGDHPKEAELLAAEATARLRSTQLVAHFNTIFGVLEPELLATIESLMEWVTIRAGNKLFSAGDPGDAAFLVATGRLGVYAVDPQTGFEREIGQIGRGDLVGEIALLDEQTRTAAVYAVRDSQLIKFSRAAYEALLERYPKLGLLIARVALGRQRQGRVRYREGHHSFIVVPISPGVDISGFAADLVRELGPTSRSISSTEVDAMLGRPAASQIGDDDVGALRLSYTLEELENGHANLVYLPDDTWTPWSRRAMRWSDHVVLVADATDEPAQSPHELELWSLVARQRHPDVSLVLLQPSDTERPSGTPAWLDHRDVGSHHHVRRGERRHLARLARLLTGSGTSIVLGGGAAKGFAHLGVLEVLEELGVELDMVAGTSIGSIMATGVAFEMDAAERKATAIAAFDDIIDVTLPTTAMIKGGKVSRALREHYQDTDITDLWVPFFCVATDLTECRARYLDEGDLARAVRASISIPAMMPPVPLDGNVLVDGAVLDNVPVAEMRRRNPTGTVIAVDVSPPGGRGAKDDYGLAVGGFAAMRARRKGSGPPSLMGTIMQATLVASAGARREAIDEGIADLYLQVGVDSSGLLDFSSGGQMIETTADSTRPVLEDWATRWADNEGDLMPEVVTTRPPRKPIITADRKRKSGGTMLLTLRDFQFRASRFGSVVLGIAVVLALLFLMTGLTEQFHREPRVTVDAFEAEAWLLRDGATGAFTSAATMPVETADAVEGVDAAPLVIGRHTLTTGGDSTDIVVIGFEPGGLGEPDVVDGSLPAAPGEVVIDDASDLGPGDTALVGSTSFAVTGNTDGRTMFAGMPLLFLEIGDAQDLLYRGQPQATTVLLGGIPETVPDGFEALTPDEVADDATRPLERSISSVNLVRVLLWLVAALIIGTMTYLSALERRRDVAVLKAVGASTRQLGVSMALQGVFIALVAAILASGLQVVMVPIFPLDVSVPARAFWQIPLIAVIVSLVAGLAGLRKAVGVDPALAFSGPGA